MRLALVLAALTLGGCQLYFGGDDEPCAGTRGGVGYEDGYPSNYLRDPQTGDCTEFGGYGGGGCDACGNCYDEGIAQPSPNWPQCESQCGILDEESCITEPGCQVAYWENTDYQDAPSVTTFRGCYATVGGPELYASCWNLDAYGCAQHDECSIFYTQDYAMPNPPTGGGDKDDPTSGSWSQFSRCAPEATQNGCTAVNCGPGYHCEDSCYPTPGCGMGGGTTPPGPNNPDCKTGGTQCTPMCVPDNGYGCAAVDCGPGYECVETCETNDPSTMGGCFPGQCYATCVPTTACETLTDQTACDARGDCTSVFNGEDCTCYPGGYCECLVLTWDHCESLGNVPMPL